MSLRENLYIGPIAVGFLPQRPVAEFEGELTPRLFNRFSDDATYHWVPKEPRSSPTLATIDRYADGSTGSYVLHTSSEGEIALFKSEYAAEIEVLESNYERVDIIFGVISF